MRLTSWLLCLPFALMLAGTAEAQSSSQSYSRISKVQIGSDDYLYVTVPGNLVPVRDPVTRVIICHSRYWARSQYKIDHPKTRAMMQIALTSYVSLKPVHIYTNGCAITQRPVPSHLRGRNYPVMVGLQVQEGS